MSALLHDRTLLVLQCAALLAIGSSCCLLPASRRAQVVDFQPLLDVSPLMSTASLRAALPRHEALVSAGIQLEIMERRRDGVLDLLVGGQSFRNEHVESRVAVFRDEEGAALSLASFCERWGGNDVAWAERDAIRMCWSPVIESREDPAGACIPHGVYYSVAGITFRTLVVTFEERGADAELVATDEAIRELATDIAGAVRHDGSIREFP